MALGALLVVILTIFIPPLGVFMVAGCGVDLLINLCLTLLGYLPGHIHAFYVEYQYYHRKSMAQEGLLVPEHVPGVYSDRVQSVGRTGGTTYGTVPQGTV